MLEPRIDLITNKESVSEKRLEGLRTSLTSLVTQISKINHDNLASVYLFGSLGRRIAISEAQTWNDYKQSITENWKLMPRMSLRNMWDADIAVQAELVPWSKLASISKEVSLANKQVEIDPHFIDLDTGRRTFKHGDTLISSSNFRFEIRTFDFSVQNDLPPIKIPDVWSQLLFYLSSKRIRPRDIPEITMLAKEIFEQRTSPDKSRISEAIMMAKNNKYLFSLKNIARWPYWIAVPYPLRVKVAKLRHVRNADIPGYDKPEPVFF